MATDKVRKIDLIVDSLLLIVKSVVGTKLYVTDKKKDEYMIKYVSKGIFIVRLFPKGENSKKKLSTKVPGDFVKTLKVAKLNLVNDKLNKEAIDFTVYSSSSVKSS